MPVHISVIDADVGRRAAVTFFLSNNDVHAEPFETVEEFAENSSRQGVALVHDDGGMIAELMQALAQRHTWLPVVGYRENPDPDQVVRAVLAGAVEYANWPGAAEKLLPAITKAANRQTATGAASSRKIVAISQIESLSPREREILAGMTAGRSNREIGAELGISFRTVELHRANLLLKLGARHSSEAIRVAIEAAMPEFAYARVSNV